MDQELLKREIVELESKLEETKASKPAHDSTGLHSMRLLELEDELAEKRKALQEDLRRAETSPAPQQEKH